MFRAILVVTLGVVVATTVALPLQPDGESNNDVQEKREDANFMLPKNIVPAYYSLKLTPYLVEGNFTFDGEVIIIFHVLETTNEIVLHAKNLTIDESMTIQEVVSGEDIIPKEHKYNTAFDFLTLSFENPLTPSLYGLRLKFTGQLDTDLYGFYRSSYVNENGDTVWLAATHFQPVSARRAFPCWDEPAFKARFDISIKHYPNYTALSNMPVMEQSAVEEDGMLWTKFYCTPVMSTNVVAFVLADFDHISNTNGTVNIWGTKQTMPHVGYALEIMENATEVMKEYTKLPVGVPKMDHVTIPDYSTRATENWGLVLYSTNALMYNHTSDSITTKENNIMTMIHEISHMWFGNLVSPSFWNYLWMSEGFATYFKYIVADKLFPDWRVLDTYGVRDMRYIFTSDMIPVQHPLNRNITNPNQIRAHYSWITYQKAGAVLRMIAHTLTEHIFHEGILKYLNQNAFDNVTPDDLSEALQSALSESDVPHDQFTVKEVLDSWEKQGGYPLVSVTRDYTTGETHLTQEAFIYDPDYSEKYNSSARWWIPISYATQSNPDFSHTSPKAWMRPQDEVTKIEGVDKDDWIILNVQETGLYRVNYDETNWKRIANCLNSDNYTDIHVINRANLITDAFAMLPTWQIDPVVFFQLLSYLERENDTVAWHSAAKIIDYIYPIIMAPEQEPIFRPRVLRLINNIVEHVGFEEKPYDDHTIKLLRPTIVSLAYRYGHVACKKRAQENMAKYIADLETHKSMSEETFWLTCEALRQAGDKAWHRLSHLYTKHGGRSYLMFLSCTNNATLLENFFDLMGEEGSPIPKHRIIDAVESIMHLNIGNIDIALNYFIKNKAKLEGIIEPSALAWQIYTNERLQKIRDNFPMDSEIREMLLAARQPIIDVCENAVTKIRDWLQRQEDEAVN